MKNDGKFKDFQVYDMIFMIISHHFEYLFKISQQFTSFKSYRSELFYKILRNYQVIS